MQGDEEGDGDEFAHASSSTTRFSEVTKSMIRASSASQSILSFFSPRFCLLLPLYFSSLRTKSAGDLRVAPPGEIFRFYKRHEETTSEEAAMPSSTSRDPTHKINATCPW